MSTRCETVLLLTCEHGGNLIPKKFARRFAEHDQLLGTHRGWDLGALATAKHFAKQHAAKLFFSQTSRLLVDLNRSESNPALFSKLIAPPSEADRGEIVNTIYRPWRQEVLDWIHARISEGRFVHHISFHSFTPTLNGEVRTAEIGLLYDPARHVERSFCHAWRDQLRQVLPAFRVRMNYPYRGTADGHTTYLRKQFPGDQYAGIELEVNQQLYQASPEDLRRLLCGLSDSLPQSLNLSGGPGL